MLGQTERDLECLVVDDASTDDTTQVLATFDDERLVVLRNDEKVGPFASANPALARRGYDAAGFGAVTSGSERRTRACRP